MRPIAHTETRPGYGRGSLRPHTNYIAGITARLFDRDGEGGDYLTPCPPIPFELAAVLCGHDPLTVTGASNARRDFHVWDLVNGVTPLTFDTTHADDPGVTVCHRDASGLHFFGCGCPDEPPADDDLDTRAITGQRA